ncbi:MAG: hypothetical protein Q8P41_03185 [Pseudomonadota bacterium]|nr:hypothetical protein [Pseudomonadota bacterium]
MLLLLLAACDTPSVEECADLAPPPVSACFGGETLTYEGFSDLAASAEGTVVSVARGPRPEACLVTVGNGALEQGLVIVFEDAAGVAWTVAVDVPDLADTFLAAGDTVSFTGTYSFGGFTPAEGAVALYDADGNLRLLVEQAGWIEDLPLPDVEVTEGQQRCTVVDDCGDYSKYDMDVTVAGQHATVAYGEQADLDGLRVVHGGYQRAPTLVGDVCEDWIPDRLALAVVVLPSP